MRERHIAQIGSFFNGKYRAMPFHLVMMLTWIEVRCHRSRRPAVAPPVYIPVEYNAGEHVGPKAVCLEMATLDEAPSFYMK